MNNKELTKLTKPISQSLAENVGAIFDSVNFTVSYTGNSASAWVVFHFKNNCAIEHNSVLITADTKQPEKIIKVLIKGIIKMSQCDTVQEFKTLYKQYSAHPLREAA